MADLKQWARNAILTDSRGRPFQRPVPPRSSATMSKIAYVRAVHTYNDAVTDWANRAFDQGFRRALKAGKDA